LSQNFGLIINQTKNLGLTRKQPKNKTKKKKQIKHQKTQTKKNLNKTDQTQKKNEEHQEHRNEPSNVEPKTDRIWSKRRHIHVENHARINNLASI
jgi:hypothetical protein